jgi:hypothetical protein
MDEILLKKVQTNAQKRKKESFPDARDSDPAENRKPAVGRGFC